MIISGAALAACSSTGSNAPTSGGEPPPTLAPAPAPSAPAGAAAGHASCDAVAEGYAAAINAQDAAAWRARYPSEARAGQVLVCPDIPVFASIVRDEVTQDLQWDLEAKEAGVTWSYDAQATR